MPRFVPRERKHKKIARVHKATNTSTTNAEQIIPESQTEREARRDALKAELRAAQPESKGSSKKRKRLDKYIDTKLKKDENAELLKKLEGHRVDTSLLQSSKKLGRTRDTQREKLARAINERNAGIGSNDDFLFVERAEVDSVDENASGGSQDEIPTYPAALTAQSNGVTPNFGGGLKRPLKLDDSGRPVIQKRKRRKKNVSQTSGVGQEEDVESEDAMYANGNLTDESANEHAEEEWTGFSPAPSEEEDDHVSDISVTSDDLEQDSASTASSQSSSATNSPDEKPARLSAFKAWADTQRNTALDFTPSANPTSASDSHAVMAAAKANFTPRVPSPDPQSKIFPAQPRSDRPTSKPAYAITIPRSEEVQAARLELPVVQEEQKIMEAINANPVVVVCGATGSGKTTQVPQMLLENGYASSISNAKGTAVQQDAPPQSRGMIGVTQPRRVAATSVATRVSNEFGVECGKCVAHQVRYDTNVGKDTAIKFMTDGILLREIQQDFILSKYSVVVLDEAHERSVNTDLLIGLLSRIVALRAELAEESQDKHYPLKLIIMSATLSQGVDSFLQNTRLWNKLGGPPPIIEAEGRQFPVTVHFARKTRRDYVSEIVDKVARGHRKLPPGGMLVFLTGLQEISDVAKRLRGKIGGSTLAAGRIDADADDYEDGVGVGREANDYLEGEEDASDSDSDAEIRLNNENHERDAEFDVEDLEPDRRSSTTSARALLKPHILPLYAALPAAQQLRVFQPPPSESHRSIILATNVAETSLTIPGIRYVFDSGRVKEKRYNTSTGVQTFEVDWISKASAEQRKGRAGRTGPGHVWRLYSSAVYEEFFAEETVPEILRTPLESTVLQLKAMEIENVVHFPFPTALKPVMLEHAELLLRNLGAIEVGNGGVVSKTGKDIMRFPVSPRFGKMLMLARSNRVVAHAVALVAALAVGDLTIPEAQSNSAELADEDYQDEEDSDSDDRARRQAENIMKAATDKRHQDYTRAQAKLAAWDDRSDAVKLLTTVAAHAETSSGDSATQFCKSYWLREKGMEEVQLLRKQLHNIVLSQESSCDIGVSFLQKLPLPTEQERTKLNQIVAAGFIDQIVIRADMLEDGAVGFGRKPKRAIEVPYRTLFPTMDADTNSSTKSSEETELRRSVFVHPSSVLARLSVKEMPQYIVYSHLSRASPSSIDESKQRIKKTRMHALTAIGPKALAALAEGTPLLQMGKPVGKIEELPRGSDGKQRRQCWVNISLKGTGTTGHDGTEWPLGVWKVVQRRGIRDWEVKEVLAR
ncbi:putative ATP-dependent RNA helicase DHR1 [Vermiconidia calcicola]|uniref:ATP-dependent RNA helicase DHR1 n=1 Tax=Vermiconidia calcicola TaxID=1690605 RepID=A0ACC3MP20_9PEZI|nr:putative ATP-dependent RNA helicase DHR1 [Vermiconidia calcicola]